MVVAGSWWLAIWNCFCGLEHGFLWYPVGGRYESDFVAGFKVRWLNSFFYLSHFLFIIYPLSIITVGVS